MLFSKSFGYAVRSVLYIASLQKANRFVSLEEISTELLLPKQFLGRVLKNMVKAKVISSFKGPTGGFMISKEGMQVTLITILEITDGNCLEQCVLKSKNCNPSNPCPAHFGFEKTRKAAKEFLCDLTIADMIGTDHKSFVKSLSEKNGNGRKS